MSDKTQEPSAEDAISLVSDKWAIEVLRAIGTNHNRYGMMQRQIPEITRKMLTQTLRRLERNGIVERIDYEENPPHVEYRITPAGDALVQRLTEMCEWTKDFMADVERSREEYDAKQSGWI